MFWNRKRKQEEAESRKELREAIDKRIQAAEDLIARIDRFPVDRRVLDASFDGPEKRHA